MSKIDRMYDDLLQYVELLETRMPKYVVGFDETGNGAVAGPLCVGACALSVDFSEKVKDSKKYSTDKARKRAYELVIDHAELYRAYMVMPTYIEAHGHATSLKDLYSQALTQMYQTFGDDAIYILDGDKPVHGHNTPHVALVKADDFVPAVSAASIVAKFERDKIMQDVEFFPWRFDKSKGYPTPEHLERLETLGPIKGFHRMNVSRVKKAFDKCGWYEKDDETNK